MEDDESGSQSPLQVKDKEDITNKDLIEESGGKEESILEEENRNMGSEEQKETLVNIKIATTNTVDSNVG